jgi:hypothetical protein
MSAILGKFADTFRQFAKGGHVEIYKYIFGSPQWPYWFGAQCVWSCFVVRRSWLGQPRTIINCVKQFIVASLMTFASREVFAVFLNGSSPIRAHPQTVGIFAAVFFIITFSPFDVVFKVLNFAPQLVSFVQAFNVMRYFTLILRKTKSLDDAKLLPVSVGFVVLDQFLEIVLRGFLSGVETSLSNGRSVVLTSFATIGWWLATRRTHFTKWMGLYDPNSSALVAGFVLWFVNSALAATAIADRPARAEATATATAAANGKETPGPEPNMVNFSGTHAQLMERVGAEQGAVVVELWAEWNAGCRKLQTRLPLIAVEHPEAKFVMVECGQNAGIALSMEVDSVPDVRFYIGGVPSGRVVGYDTGKIQEKLLEFTKN